MPVLIRIAFRNMWEHKAKSVIIGGLLGMGVLIMIVGNAMVDSAADGLRRGYIESYTGDVMVSGVSEQPFSIFGSESMDMTDDEELPIVPEYETVYAKLTEDPRVASVSGLVTSFGLLSRDYSEDALADVETDSENMIFGIIFGVDLSTYFDLFPGLTLKEGSLPKPGENAVLLPQGIKDKLDKKYNTTFVPGDKILITGIMGGMRLREVTLVGIYDRGEVNENAPFIISDADTVRVLAGLTMSVDETIELDASQTSLLASDNPDDIFGGDLFGGDMIGEAAVVDTNVQFDNAASLLGDTSKRELLNTAQSGSWHFLLVRLTNENDTYPFIAEMSDWAKEEGIQARVADWKEAAGTYGKMADLVRVIFNIAIIVIAIVAVIIIMNTLVISIIERTAEIGTMRALGAKRSFVRLMFLTETLTQSVFFGLLGAGVAVVGMLVVNACNIPLENGFAQLLLGGETVHLVPSAGTIISTIVAVFLVGWLAHLYPVSIALKIQPVKAMQSE